MKAILGRKIRCKNLDARFANAQRGGGLLQQMGGSDTWMIIEKTTLGGVRLIKLDGFEDHRGEYVELYNERLYKSKVININFV